MPAFCSRRRSQAEADRDSGGSRSRLSRREKPGTPNSRLLRDRRKPEKRLVIFTASTCGSWGAPGVGRAGGEGLMQVVARERSPDSMPSPGLPERARMRTRRRRSGGRVPAVAAPCSTSTPLCRSSPSSTRRRPRAPTRWSPCWARTGWWRSPTWSATSCGWVTPEWHAWWTAARWQAWSQAPPPSR